MRSASYMKNKFYVTTSIVYTNAEPHIGYAMELIQADVLARYHRLKGEETWFLTGTDEHGIKIARAAEAHHQTPKEFVDGLAVKFESLPATLNVANDDFIRTSDQTRHWPAAQKLWEKLAENGDLYKKDYEGYYCVGHEAFIKKSELVDSVCPIHKTKPETVKEENWFFKISKYKDAIKKAIEKDELKILPASKKKEILNLIDDAEDVSVSRPTKTLVWGIPVPDDPEQTMYVWVDALTNYISALGWAHNGEDFKKFWPADVHLIGKDILRFHALIWPAMLLAAGIELPKAIWVHGFITVDGEKMSKSVGNVVDPVAVVKKYTPDVVRYFLLREIPSDEDGDFSETKLVQRYNGDLANGLGNLVSRVVTLIDKNLDAELIYKEQFLDADVALVVADVWKRCDASVENFKLHEALASIWELVAFADKYMNDTKPWAVVESGNGEFMTIMTNLVMILHNITRMLLPFMSQTAEKIMNVLGIEPGIDPVENFKFSVTKGAGLFPRLEE